MNDIFEKIYNSPWAVEFIGGGMAALIVGIILLRFGNSMVEKAQKNEVIPIEIRAIISIGKILLLPFVAFFFILAAVMFPLLYLTASTGQCRYSPTCRDYLLDAIKEHGIIGGVWLGMKRVSRCRPKGGYGNDPVPAKSISKWNF